MSNDLSSRVVLGRVISLPGNKADTRSRPCGGGRGGRTWREGADRGAGGGWGGRGWGF